MNTRVSVPGVLPSDRGRKTMRPFLLVLAFHTGCGLLSWVVPPKTVQIKGKPAAIVGSGPPVVVSTGLFGTMPRQLYSDLFSQLSKNLTLIFPAGPLPKDILDATADSLEVDSVGYISHSSFNGDILSSPKLRAAVLYDPVVTPLMGEVIAPPNAVSLRAERTYSGDGVTVPSYLSLPSSKQVWFPNMAHADILDDRWADLAQKVFPFMRTSKQTVDYTQWSQDDVLGRNKELNQQRAAYRESVARLTLDHLLGEGAGGARGVVAHLE